MYFRTVQKSSISKLALAAIAVLLVAAPLALAEELTREEYVERVEPVCKTNADANSRILKGVKAQVQEGQLVPAGKRFIRAATALGKAVRQIASAPRPAADAAKLSKWIGYLKSEKSYLQRIGQALKAGDKRKAYQLAVKLKQNNTEANNTVLSFGFHECRISSSRFL